MTNTYNQTKQQTTAQQKAQRRTHTNRHRGNTARRANAHTSWACVCVCASMCVSWWYREMKWDDSAVHMYRSWHEYNHDIWGEYTYILHNHNTKHAKGMICRVEPSPHWVDIASTTKWDASHIYIHSSVCVYIIHIIHIHFYIYAWVCVLYKNC